jgi:hypothetical protein
LIRAVAGLLLLTSGSLIAGELPFKAPDTALAQENGPLLHRAARALDSLSSVRGGISDLWLFPTAEPGTVFARYRVTLGHGAARSEQLAVLTLDGDRLVKLEELTDARPAPRPEEHGTPRFPWTAVNTGPDGVPGSPHWTALIGTGHASGPAAAAAQGNTPSSSAQTQRPTADFYWAAAIGTGHAAELKDGLSAASAGTVHTRDSANVGQ